jgi:hypothetical protein
MLNTKPCLTLMVPGTTLSKEASSPCEDPHLYRSVIGVLQYATLTRPSM